MHISKYTNTPEKKKNKKVLGDLMNMTLFMERMEAETAYF